MTRATGIALGLDAIYGAKQGARSHCAHTCRHHAPSVHTSYDWVGILGHKSLNLLLTKALLSQPLHLRLSLQPLTLFLLHKVR